MSARGGAAVGLAQPGARAAYHDLRRRDVTMHLWKNAALVHCTRPYASDTRSGCTPQVQHGRPARRRRPPATAGARHGSWDMRWPDGRPMAGGDRLQCQMGQKEKNTL